MNRVTWKRIKSITNAKNQAIDMSRNGALYTAAQEELATAISTQQTISVKKLNRLLQSLNISIKPGKSTENTEIAYLKAEIKKRQKKMVAMGQEIKALKDRK